MESFIKDLRIATKFYAYGMVALLVVGFIIG